MSIVRLDYELMCTNLHRGEKIDEQRRTSASKVGSDSFSGRLESEKRKEKGAAAALMYWETRIKSCKALVLVSTCSAQDSS